MFFGCHFLKNALPANDLSKGFCVDIAVAGGLDKTRRITEKFDICDDRICGERVKRSIPVKARSMCSVV